MMLLDYLGEPDNVTLHPWPLLAEPIHTLTREDALTRRQVMIVHQNLGSPVPTRIGDAAMQGASKASVFNRMNWKRLSPSPHDALVDSNASPVLLWTPAGQPTEALRPSSLGSQADSMAAVSNDFERWVNRSLSWVRRNGTRVWGPEKSTVRPDLDIKLSFINPVFALPGALKAFEQGLPGR